MPKFTLLLQKSVMFQFQGIKGEAVVTYREPLITQEMEYHRLSRRVKNMAFLLNFWISPGVNSWNIAMLLVNVLLMVFSRTLSYFLCNIRVYTVKSFLSYIELGCHPHSTLDVRCSAYPMWNHIISCHGFILSLTAMVLTPYKTRLNS